MYCRKCGAPNEDSAQKCIKCGEVLQPAIGGGAVVTQKIPNYLAQSILVTVLCCMPLGIPGIVYSAQVNGKVQAGDIQGAIAASKKAKMWCWWSFGIGLVINIIYTIFMILGGLAEHLR
jgi:hypothetical protein